MGKWGNHWRWSYIIAIAIARVPYQLHFMAEVDSDIDFLPLDVISLILLYLPVSSLLRFKSISKSWLSLIESSDFVYKHFNFHQNQQKLDLILLTWPYLFEKPKKIENPQQASLFSVSNPRRQLPLDLPVIQDPYRITCPKIVASCNGIICIHQGRAVCLWNPATKKSTNLPPLPVLSSHCLFGFGFDPITRDYKVVTVNCLSNDIVSHVYSLSSDSWRNLEGLVLPDMCLASSLKASYRERFFCWLVWADILPEMAVYTFDFSDEVFEAIPIPSSIYAHALFILHENIACVGRLRNQENDGLDYEIWMLSDYQVKESWTKLYSIDAFSDSIDWMTWFSNNGEFFLILAGTRLCLYDLLTQQVIDLPVRVGDSRYEVAMYRESMLSIKRGNGAANEVTSMDCNRRMSMNQPITGNSRWGDSDVHKAATFHILLWLPVVSLLRFKSVCKSWYSLIKSSDFVTQHLFLHHNQNQDNLSLILHSTNIIHYPMFEDSSHHCLNASATCLLSSDKLELLDFPISESYYGLAILTSFNGIICLSNSSYGEVYLWNPITKQFRDLYPKEGSNQGPEDFSFGFVFDAKTNNCKLVRFYGGDESDRVAHVYCLNTDSWRIIDAEILPTVRHISSGLDAPYRDEIYCWLADVGYSSVILWFDFSNEVFGTMPLPDSINKSSLTAVLTVLMDKIVCISLGEKYYSDDTDYWHCEIWMMKEYGVAESWVKLYMVGPFSKDWRFKMCYSKKNGDYMLLLKDGQLYEYDLVMQNTKRLPYQIQGPKDYQVLAYKESLVPIE